MHGKGELAKMKGSICNVPIEAAIICIILPRKAVSNELFVVKLRRDLKYRDHVYFESVRPNTICQELAYFKSHSKFYEEMSLAMGLSSEEMFIF